MLKEFEYLGREKAYEKMKNSQYKQMQDFEDVMNKEADATIKESDRINAALKTVEDKVKKSEEEFKNLDFTTAFTSGANAALQLTSAISSLTNIPDIITNEDLSMLEKVIQLISALSITILMTGGAIDQGRTFIDKTWSSIKNWVATTDEAIETSNALAVATKKGIFVKKVDNQTTREAIKENIKSRLAQKAKIAGDKEETKEIWKKVGAKLKDILITKGPYLLSIAAVVAALAVLVSYYDKEEKAIKRVSQANQELADSYQKTRDSFNNLETSFTQYQSAIKTLDECIVGTEEWNNALKDTNDTTLELLENLNLAGVSAADIQAMQEKDSVTGTTRFNEDSVKAIIAEQERQANAAQYAKISGDSLVTQAESNKTVIDATRNNQYNTGIDERFGAGAAGVTTAAVVGVALAALTVLSGGIIAAIAVPLGVAAGVGASIMFDQIAKEEQEKTLLKVLRTYKI